jgi:hypothetical protein
VDIYHEEHEKLERGWPEGDFLSLEISKTEAETEKL